MTEIPMPSDDLIIKAADDAGLCFPTCWGLANAEEEADDAAFAATSPEAAEIVAKHEQLKRDRLEQLRNFWNTAASYGADQELEACCEWLESEPDPGHVDLLRSCATALRDARRPKPQSLNSVALEMLSTIEKMDVVIPEITDTIRRALEALPDD